MALKASDQVLRYSIDKATVELLYLPVPPGLTFRVKSFIDTVVYRFGRRDRRAHGAAVWRGARADARADVVGVARAGRLLALGGGRGAAAIRREPAREHPSASCRRRARKRAGASSARRREMLAERLTGTPERDSVCAQPVRDGAGPDRASRRCAALLKHESGEVRQHALRLLSRAADDLTVRHDVERLLYDQHLEVRTEALLYLAEHAHIDPLERIEQLGDFPDFSLRAAMAAFLARPGRAQNLDAARAIIGAMVPEAGARVGASGSRRRVCSACSRMCSTGAARAARGSRIRRSRRRRSARSRRCASAACIRRVIERLGEPALTEEAVAGARRASATRSSARYGSRSTTRRADRDSARDAGRVAGRSALARRTWR